VIITPPASQGRCLGFTPVASHDVFYVVPPASDVITVPPSQVIPRDNSIPYTKVCTK
jgi:hypothetical protein